MNSEKNKNKNLIFEACVANLSEALQAEKKGAHRVELCFDLKNAGLTPPENWIIASKKLLSIPVFVIIRPTFRDFFYTNEEFELMKKQIIFCKENEIDGVVFGIIKKRNDLIELDLVRNKELAELAKPMKITFHMAFDLIAEESNLLEEQVMNRKLEAIDKLVEMKFDRILTKGCTQNAIIGKDNLKKMIEYAKNRIIIMPGGGVNEANKIEIAEDVNCKEVHGTKIVGELN